MPSERPYTNGELAADAAARKYGLERNDGSAGYWDAVYSSNGRKVSIKSARYERADGPGVFRLWRENLKELKEVMGSVVLAVVNPSNEHRKVLRVVKRSPGALLDAADWRLTGQADMAGMHEARLPWPEVVSLR